MYSWTKGGGGWAGLLASLQGTSSTEKNIFKLIRKNTTGLFTFKWFDVRMEKAFICIKAENSTCH